MRCTAPDNRCEADRHCANGDGRGLVHFNLLEKWRLVKNGVWLSAMGMLGPHGAQEPDLPGFSCEPRLGRIRVRVAAEDHLSRHLQRISFDLAIRRRPRRARRRASRLPGLRPGGRRSSRALVPVDRVRPRLPWLRTNATPHRWSRIRSPREAVGPAPVRLEAAAPLRRCPRRPARAGKEIGRIWKSLRLS